LCQKGFMRRNIETSLSSFETNCQSEQKWIDERLDKDLFYQECILGSFLKQYWRTGLR
jgi:hypothetical protein